MSTFTAKTLGGDLAFGGPDATGAGSQAVFGSLVYLQYTHPDTQNCMLVFAAQTEESIFAVFEIIDASQLSPALHAVVTPQQDWLPSLNCSPMGWGDINRNGKSDMAVTFLWANHITGSETHIFEVQEDSTVVDLVADLPGIVSPWSFDPSETSLYVFDMEFAHHDCMYPPLSVIWVYDWRDGDYKDVTAEWDFSDYVESLQTTVEDGYGNGFSPYLFLEPLTKLLTMYDRQGRRAEGWNLYLDMTDLEHWPGTDAESEMWLKSDVQHFAEQYERGVPFTANNYCSEQ